MQTADTSFNFLIYNVLLSIGIACFFDSLLERNYKILSLPACIMICSVAALITETILIHQVVMRNIFTYACWYSVSYTHLWSGMTLPLSIVSKNAPSVWKKAT